MSWIDYGRSFFAQKGRGNKADSGILKELHDRLGNEPTVNEVKDWLQDQYEEARAAGDNGRAERIKITQKALRTRRSREE